MEQAIRQSVQTTFTDGVPPNGLPSGTSDLRLGGIAKSRNFLFPLGLRVSLTAIFAHRAHSFASARVDRAGEGAGAYALEFCADPSLGQMRL